jgi:hypothetical protein
MYKLPKYVKRQSAYETRNKEVVKDKNVSKDKYSQ